jgi:hypothetical protein
VPRPARAHTSGVAARCRLVIQPRHPPANRRQGLAGHGQGQPSALAGRQRQVQAGVIAGHQAAQPGTIGRRVAFGAKVAAGAPQRQGQVVDAGPLAHEVESASSTGRSVANPTLLSQKSPWTNWQGSREASPPSAWVTSPASSSATVARRRSAGAGSQPRIRSTPPADGGRNVGRPKMVGEPWPASLLVDLQGAQQVVGLGQQPHPGLQARPAIHDRVMAHIRLRLNQPALEVHPGRTLPGRNQWGARHAPGQQHSSGLMDRTQPRRRHIGSVDAHHIAAVGLANQQVQAGRPAQVDRLGEPIQPPMVPERSPQAGPRPGPQPPKPAVGVIHDLTLAAPSPTGPAPAA